MSAEPTLRQVHEAEVYDRRAEQIGQTLDDATLVVDGTRPPYPNREHVDFLDTIYARLGDLDDRRILEVGCGSGTLSSYHALRGARAVGVDVSEGMLAIARRRAEMNGVADRVELIAAAIEDLDEPDGSFDAVIANQVLHHLDLPRALPNIARMLKPGGQALFAEPVLLMPAFVERVRYSRPVERRFPSRRDTPDERSIDAAALEEIRASFARTDVLPFQLLTRAQNFVELSDRAFARLEQVDRRLLRSLRPVRRFCRYVVIAGSGRPPVPLTGSTP